MHNLSTAFPSHFFHSRLFFFFLILSFYIRWCCLTSAWCDWKLYSHGSFFFSFFLLVPNSCTETWTTWRIFADSVSACWCGAAEKCKKLLHNVFACAQTLSIHLWFNHTRTHESIGCIRRTLSNHRRQITLQRERLDAVWPMVCRRFGSL